MPKRGSAPSVGRLTTYLGEEETNGDPLPYVGAKQHEHVSLHTFGVFSQALPIPCHRGRSTNRYVGTESGSYTTRRHGVPWFLSLSLEWAPTLLCRYRTTGPWASQNFDEYRLSRSSENKAIIALVRNDPQLSLITNESHQKRASPVSPRGSLARQLS